MALNGAVGRREAVLTPVLVLLMLLTLQLAGSAEPRESQSKSTRRVPAAATQRARLVYSLYQGLLTGTAGGRAVSLKAYSGGGGGSTKGASDPFAVNNPLMTDQEQAKKVRGGPIPVGQYVIMPPAPWHGSLAAVLVPRATMKRSGFLIHGRGPLGSDGCIVLGNNEEFHDLMQRLTKDGGGLLTVTNESTHRQFR